MRLPRQIAYPPCFQRFSSTVPNSSRANLALSSHSLSGSGSRTYGIPSRSTDRRSSIVDHAISRSSTPSARRAPLSGSKRVQYRVVSYHDTRAAMAEDGGTAAAPPPPPGDEEQQKRAPKISLKKPPTREDIPQLQSTVRLVNHEFSARQRECLVRDEGVGPLYEAMMKKCVQFGDKPRKLAMCCSRQLCRKEQAQLIACIRATRDASLCHEFRDEVERCGVRMSQRMLRAALSDDWF